MEQAPRRAIAFVFAEHAATTVTAAATVVALGGGLLAVGLVESSKSTTPASPLDNHWILTGLILGILGVAVAIANVVVLVLRRMAAERWRTHLAILTNQGQNMLTRSIAGQSVPLKDIADWYAIVRDDLEAARIGGA